MASFTGVFAIKVMARQHMLVKHLNKFKTVCNRKAFNLDVTSMCRIILHVYVQMQMQVCVNLHNF